MAKIDNKLSVKLFNKSLFINSFPFISIASIAQYFDTIVE